MNSSEIHLIARTANKALKSYSEGNADYSMQTWDKSPQDVRDGTIMRVQYRIDNPNESVEDHCRFIAAHNKTGIYAITGYQKKRMTLFFAIVDALSK